MLTTWQYHTQYTVTLLPGYDIHHWLCLIITLWKTTIESLKQFLSLVLRITADKESGSRIIHNLPNTVVFILFHYLHQIAAQSLPTLLQGQYSCADNLQVGMVGCRGSTFGTII